MRSEEREGTRRLPAGPHGIPAELVARNQRERLVAAIAEACAERGYAETSVADVTKRAGVSSVTFYRLFADKRECMLAAHRALLGRLLEAVDGARAAEGWQGGIRAMLSLLAADAPSARLLSVEILAVGPEGMQSHNDAVEAFAKRLEASWILVAGIFALVGKLVTAGEADRLPELADELVATISSRS
ncbi:MAG TPA: helix-turn-helix domain-containing protein [Solirubrobacterales bacterium]|nr:helix-turn-helix domain-containing protein [Solirubrobacterales bacterium]